MVICKCCKNKTLIVDKNGLCKECENIKVFGTYKPKEKIKWIMFLFVFVFLFSLASAFEWDNTMDYKPAPVDEITITNALGFGSDLLKAKLNNNMCDENGRFCEATKTITLYDNEPLVQDFRTLRLDDGSNSEQDIRWWKIEYLGQIDDYEYQCSDTGETSINGTAIQECSNVKVGSHEGWIRYNLGDVLPAGTYEVKTSGEIRPGRVYDWQIKLLGEWTTPWAIWGNISLGAEAEVILNSPANGATVYNANTLFNGSANVTGGATLVNMSLWNDDGGWSLKNVSTVLNFPNIDYDFDTDSFTDIGSGFGVNTGNSRLEFSGNRNTAGDLSYIANSIGSTEDISIGFEYTMTSGALNSLMFVGVGDSANQFTSLTNALGILVQPSSTNPQIRLAKRASSVESSNSSYVTTFGTTYYIFLKRSGGVATLEIWDSDKTSLLNTQTLSVSNTAYTHFMVADYDGDEGTGYNFAGYIDSLGTTIVTTSSTQTWNYTIPAGDTIWNVQACDSDGDCGFATSNYTVSLDSTPPSISILYPTGTIDTLTNEQNVSLNYSISDTNLNVCWYEYNGANVTTPCSLNSSFIYSSGVNTIKLWANDTIGNTNSSTSSWTPKIQINNESHNSTTFETASETFSINLTANSSLTAVTLNYNGTEYSLSQSGSVWSKTLDIPLNKVQNNSFYYEFTYGGSSINSPTYYQNVSETVWTLCNATYSDDFLNISFKDEDDLSSINASIPTSTWVYYLGSGDVTKSYLFINNTENWNYTFCSNAGSRTLYVDPVVQFKQGIDYPQRTWDATVQSYTQSVTQKVLYLLSSIDGVYQEFIVQSQSGSIIEGVNVVGSRQINGDIVNVAQGDTDGSGSVTFWLNPDFSHDFVFSKSGYENFELTFTPTGTSKTIVMGGGTSPAVIDDYTKGVSYSTRPASDYLEKDTSYTFNYTISSNYWTLDTWGFTLKYQNGTEIGTQSSSSPGGGTVSLTANTTNQSRVIMSYYYEINDTYFNFTRNWKVYESNDYSLNHFFERTSTYISADLFGILGDDNGQFSRALLSFVILIMVAGGLTMRYGLNSEAAIMGIMFGVVLFLNTVNLLPNLSVFENALISFGDLLATIMAILVVAFIVKEERA